MQLKKFAFLFLLFFTVDAGLVMAQMFSVENRPQRLSAPSSYIRAGVGLTDFVYTGNEAGPEQLEFASPVFVVMYEGFGLNGSVAFGNNLSGLKDRNFFELQLQFSNRFPIVRRPNFFVGIPVHLGTGITTTGSEAYEESFNQTHFKAGAGGFFSLNLGERVSFNNEFIPSYGFGNSSGGFFGGSLFSLVGSSRINILRFFGNRSLSLGYDYNFKSFDIDQELYDYDLTIHMITIGVSL